MLQKYKAIFRAPFTEAVEDDLEGREWRVTIIEAGLSANKHNYPLEVLHQGFEKFEGLPCYMSEDVDHDPKARGVRAIVGFVKKAFTTPNGIGGIISVTDPTVRESLKEWKKGGVLAKFAGLSIVAAVMGRKGKGQIHVDKIIEGESVDIVRNPAAGGKFISILEAIEESQEDPNMCERCNNAMAACTCSGGAETEGEQDIAKQVNDALAAALAGDTVKESITQMVKDALAENQQAEEAKCPCDDDDCKGCPKGERMAKEMGNKPPMRSQQSDGDGNGQTPPEGEGEEHRGEGEGDPEETTTQESVVTTTNIDPSFLKMIQESHIDGLIRDARLPDHSTERIRKMFDTSTQLDMDKVREAIKDEKDYLAASETAIVENLTESRIIDGRVVADEVDKKLARMDAMFEKTYSHEYERKDKSGKVRVPAYMSFSEAFCDWTGIHPHKVRGNDIWRAFAASSMGFDSSSMEVREGEIYKALEADGGTAAQRLFTQPYGTTAQRDASTVQWGSVISDRLYRSMVRNYYSLNYFEKWRQLVKFVPAKDFREIKRIKIGWFSDLPEVSQGGQYQDAVFPEDQITSFSVRKYGMHAQGISREMIIDDDIGVINEVPMKLAKAAAHTIYVHIFKTMLAQGTSAYRYYNPDGTNTALYTTAHKNLLTGSALTGGTLDDVIIAMRTQTIYNEPEPTRYNDAGRGTQANPRSADDYVLGDDNEPKFLIVPTRNMGIAQRLTNPSRMLRVEIPGLQGVMDNDGNVLSPTKDQTVVDNPERFSNLETIVVDDLDVNIEAILLADPYAVETMVFSFLNGQQHPDIIVQSDPQVGDNFERDTMTYKIRHEWGSGITDHRGTYMVRR